MDMANQRLFTVCRANKGMSVLDIRTGKVITTVPIGAGVDAVIYDAAGKLVFTSNGDGTATIIKQESADKYSVIQTLTTAPRARSMPVRDAVHHEHREGHRGAIPNAIETQLVRVARECPLQLAKRVVGLIAEINMLFHEWAINSPRE